MDDGSPSIDHVRDVLRLPQTTDFTTLTDVRGLSPNEILGHAKAREYTILGITPSQFMQEHGGDLFDYEQLKKGFKQICTISAMTYQWMKRADLYSSALR